jgi:hypothetical protein
MLGAALPILFGGMIAGFARSACAQPAAPKVEVLGVRVAGPVSGSVMEGLRAYQWTEGTTVALLVTVPDGGLVSVNREKMQLTQLADDKGTDLTASKNAMGRLPMVMEPQVSADGKACLVELNGGTVPAKGAAAITATGSISLQCGSKKETAREQNVALKPGTKIHVGPMAFEISRVGKPQFFFEMPGAEESKPTTPPAERFEVTLQTNQDCSSVASVAFLDAAGEDLGAKPSSSSSTGMAGKILTVEKSFVLPKKVATATISITYWTDLKEVVVPYEVKATLGL